MKTLIAPLASAIAVLLAACGSPEKPAARQSAPPPKPPAQTVERPADPYQAEIAQFQREREAALTAENGWLTIGGLWFLSQPDTTFGSDPLSDIVLPAGAPGRAGTFMLRNGKVSVKAADGVVFQLDGKPVTSAQLRADGAGPPDRIGLGDIQLWVHNSGDRLSIRMRDKNNPLRKTFVGTSWFPVNPTFRVEATYTPYKTPKVVEVPNILGDIDRMPIPGIVTFTINGQEHKLEPVAEAGDPQLWFIFRDLTSQNETYPAARFLYTDAPKDGKVILDFNRAVNPPCAYNPFTTCPLPTDQNRLRTRIEAGEMKYKGHV